MDVADVAEIARTLDDDGLAVVPRFLDGRVVRDIADEVRKEWDEGEFRRARVGRGSAMQLRPEIRSDFVRWLDPESATVAENEVLGRLEQLRQAINERMYLGLFELESHLTIYPSGAFYARHLDRFRNAEHRIVSAIVYLNDEWGESDGGTLRVYLDDGGHVDVLPKGGTLVTFMSDRFEHEVLPSVRERLSLTGWFTVRR